MTLELRDVTRAVGGRVHIHPTSLTLAKGTMNVLLGPTLSGKTSLMRLMVANIAPGSAKMSSIEGPSAPLRERTTESHATHAM